MTPHVVFSIDRRFAIPLAACLRSIETSNPTIELNATVLEIGIDSTLKSRIRRSAPKTKIEFVSIDDMVPLGLPRVKAFSRAVYGRLFAPAITVSDSERTLYLDADTIVLDELVSLFEADMRGHPFGAVQSVGIPYISSANGLPNWKELNIHPNAPYLLSGLLLIDNKQWIDCDITARVLKFAQENHDTVLWPEQDALNAVAQGKFWRLDTRWNVESLLRTPNHLGHALFDSSEVRRAEDEPAIVHFSGSPKPWQRGCTDAAAPTWWRFLEQTDWEGLAPQRRLGILREMRYRVGLAIRG